jgi:hypothetical protein
LTFIQFSSSSAGSNKGDNFTCVIIAIDVKAKVAGRLPKNLPNEELVEDLPNEELVKDLHRDKRLENLHYIAKVMPANEYRASWLQEVG